MNDITVAAIQMESKTGVGGGEANANTSASVEAGAIAKANAEANAANMCSWIERAADAGAQLVLFPEAGLTGYSAKQPADIALALDDNAAAQVERCASERGIAVGYGLIERAAASTRPYLTYVIADADGRLVYRKTHLGTHEQDAFAAGDDLPVADIAGVRVGVQLCWESHMPDIAGTLRARGAELIITPHASGSSGAHRIELWDRFLPARAYDNGLFVVACNALMRNARGERIGGGVAVYGPKGTRLASCDSLEDDMVVARIGGVLPRETPDKGMHNLSFFDRRRLELYVQGDAAEFGRGAAAGEAATPSASSTSDEVADRAGDSPFDKNLFFQHTQCDYFPCHEGVPPEHFNCLLCYCPLYALGPACGGNYTYMAKGTKNCKGCSIPHNGDSGVKLVHKRFRELADLASRKDES